MQFLPYLLLEGRGGVEGRRERGKGRRKRKGNRRGGRHRAVGTLLSEAKESCC